MDEVESLGHTKWDCKYHVVFIPKCRRKTLYAELRRHLGEVFRKLAMQKESRIEEGHLMPDHVHMMISIPPKYAVSLVGFKRLKSLIGLKGPPGADERSARPHVLAHLLIILLLEPLVDELEDSPRLAEAA